MQTQSSPFLTSYNFQFNGSNNYNFYHFCEFFNILLSVVMSYINLSVSWYTSDSLSHGLHTLRWFVFTP